MKKQITFNTAQSISREMDKVTAERDALMVTVVALNNEVQKLAGEGKFQQAGWKQRLASDAHRAAKSKDSSLARLNLALAEMNTDMLPMMAADKFDRQVVLPKLKK